MRETISFADYNTADYNFTLLFIWAPIINTHVAQYKELLLVRFFVEESQSKESVNKSFAGESISYIFPCGKICEDESNLKEAIEICIADSERLGARTSFVATLPHQVEWLKKYLSERESPIDYKIEEQRAYFDYIYDAEALITLKGKKYQSKRNFVNGFKRDNNWSYETINKGNIGEVALMNDEWCKLNGCGKNLSLQNEMCSVRQALNYFFDLDLEGGLIRVENRVVAFTIGEMLNKDTFLVHIEKAFYTVRGAYPIISQEFLTHMAEKYSFSYVNREDDTGDEGLRRAKMEYHPIKLAEKFKIELANKPY